MAAFVQALANARKAVQDGENKWTYTFVLTQQERIKFGERIQQVLDRKGLRGLDGPSIVACFKESMDASKLSGKRQHILFHVDEAGTLSRAGSNVAEKRDRILTFWKQIPFLDDEILTIQAFFTSRQWDLSLVGTGQGESPTTAEQIDFDLLTQRDIKELYNGTFTEGPELPNDVCASITHETSGVPRLIVKVLEQIRWNGILPTAKDTPKFVHDACEKHMDQWTRVIKESVTEHPAVFNQLLYLAALGVPVSSKKNILDESDGRKEYVQDAARNSGFYCEPYRLNDKVFYTVVIPPVLATALYEEEELKGKLALSAGFLPEYSSRFETLKRSPQLLREDPNFFEFAVCCAMKLRGMFSANSALPDVEENLKWEQVVPEFKGSTFGSALVEPDMYWTIAPATSPQARTFENCPEKRKSLEGILARSSARTYEDALKLFNTGTKKGMKRVNPTDLPEVYAPLRAGRMAISAEKSATFDAVMKALISHTSLQHIFLAVQAKRLLQDPFHWKDFIKEVKKCRNGVKEDEKMTIVMCFLNIPEIAKKPVKYLKSDTPVPGGFSVPKNTDVLLISEAATRRLLSPAVYDFFFHLHHGGKDDADLIIQLRNGIAKAWRYTSIEEIEALSTKFKDEDLFRIAVENNIDTKMDKGANRRSIITRRLKRFFDGKTDDTPEDDDENS